MRWSQGGAHRGLAVRFLRLPDHGNSVLQRDRAGCREERHLRERAAGSAFNQATSRRAQAYGLMQVTQDAGRLRLQAGRRRLRPQSHEDRSGLQRDPRRGPEIGGYGGFSRLLHHDVRQPTQCRPWQPQEWIDRYGDPRDPRSTRIDWVELIPFSVTRNYVQAG